MTSSTTRIRTTQKQEYERRLNEAKRDRDRFLSLAADMIAVLDSQGAIRETNPSWFMALGYSAEDLAGVPFIRLIHFPDQEGVLSHWNALGAAGGLVSFEARTLHKDGTERWLSWTVVAFDREEARYAVACDITERVREENAFRERKAESGRRQEALRELSNLAPSCTDSMIQKATQIAGRALRAARTSVWLFNDDESTLVCRDVYRRREDAHEQGLEIKAGEFPRYFQALGEARVLAASEALADPRTAEFVVGYLRPGEIVSLMDAPLRIRGKLKGIVRFEEIDEIRLWSAEEQDCAAEVAGSLAVTLAALDRERAEEEVRRLNATLERRMAERDYRFRDAISQLEAFGGSLFHDLQAPLRALEELGQALIADHTPRLDAEGRDCARRIAEAVRLMGRVIEGVPDAGRSMRVREPGDDGSALAVGAPGCMEKAG